MMDMEKYLMPQRIIFEKDVEYSEQILIEKPLQATFTDDECIKIKSGGCILLDFGRELNGGIAMTIQRTSKNLEPAKCRVVFGESVMEALSAIAEKGATNDHSIRDTVLEVGGCSTYRYGATGFRFVKIEAIDADIWIKAIKAETDIRDLEYKGSFECSDELLNEIWRVGAYTVQLNMHEFIWDGIKRDRLVWIGDMHPEVSTIRCVFGNDHCVKKSLDLNRDETPPDKWMNGIATYSMWWIIIHYDFYMHWGDLEYLKEQKEYLTKLVEKAIEFVEKDCVSENDMESFVDWSSKNTDSEREGRQSIFCMGLERAARIFDVFDMPEYVDKCRKTVEKLCREKADKSVNKRMSALTILSGRDDRFARNVLAGNSAEEMSCFMGYYVLKAKAELNELLDALDIIKDYWGGMLKMGATSFWEDFDIKWMENSARIDEIVPEGKNDIHGDFGRFCYTGFRHSLCHGWASGPTPFLIEQLSGIEILKPGCKKVKIAPNLCNLGWMKIEYPTPFGNIQIKAEKVNGKTVTEIVAPDEVEIVE